MIWFTADEHLGHENIIKYCNRPFKSIEEMDNTIIENHNSCVCDGDTVYHLGDFTLKHVDAAKEYVRRLSGLCHIFIEGSHDRWINDDFNFLFADRMSISPPMLEIKWQGKIIIMCHYAFRVWPRSHYNSWNLYGHSHGGLEPTGKQWDVGVDNNNFYPASFEQLCEIMAKQPDNFNLVKKNEV